MLSGLVSKDVHDLEEDAFASLDLFIKYRHLFEDSPGVPKQGHLLKPVASAARYRILPVCKWFPIPFREEWVAMTNLSLLTQ